MNDQSWFELSHPIDRGVAKVPFLPEPETRPIDDASLRATELRIATHVGTHLEAPRHLYDDGTTIDAYPADRWISRGVVCAVEADPLAEIGAERLDPPVPIEPGDAVMLRTGWDERVGDDTYFEQPYLSEGAAEWLAEREPAWVGIDSPSPEMPVDLREGDFEYPVHATLLGNDIPIGENLTNLGALPDGELDVIALPERYVGADGAQSRIVARPRT